MLERAFSQQAHFTLKGEKACQLFLRKRKRFLEKIWQMRHQPQQQIQFLLHLFLLSLLINLSLALPSSFLGEPLFSFVP